MEQVIKYKGYTIEIDYDEYAESPRTSHDNLTTFVNFDRDNDFGDIDGHREYGDTQKFFEHLTDINSDWIAPKHLSRIMSKYGDIEDYLIVKAEQDYIIVPVYAYIHSGVRLHIGIHRGFDYRFVGYMYVSKEKARREFGNLTKKVLAKIDLNFKGELADYNTYLNGECLMFRIYDKDGVALESVGGYYDEKHCIDEAKAVCDDLYKYALRTHLKKLKHNIKNKVPLIYRKTFAL